MNPLPCTGRVLNDVFSLIEKGTSGNLEGLFVDGSAADRCLELVAKLIHRCRASMRILFERPGEHRTETPCNLVERRGRGEMLHQNFARRFAVERHLAGKHLEQNDSQRVDVDLAAVPAACDFRRHVVNGADALRMGALAALGNELRQADVADLHDAAFAEDVRRLEIAMNDAAFVQERQAGRHPVEPAFNLLGRQAAAIFDHVAQALAADILHDDPMITVGVGLDVVDRNEIRVIEVQAGGRTAEFDVGVLVEQFQRNFLAGIGQGVIDLAEAAAMDGALDREPFQGFRFGGEGELHRVCPASPSVARLPELRPPLLGDRFMPLHRCW